jgi:hypothetical protein
VGTNVYGTEALDRYGSWRTVDTYGTVWVPAGVSAGWSPYSTGRWIWDPRYGWTWLDDAPWGWAPYHYGRWVHAGSYWAWAPGPVLVRPVYAPALVVFLGGGVSVSIGRPVYWAPLAWGEPVIPWWGRPGFVGHPWWGGWGGPRVVNNVVVHQTTTVNVTNINVYRNVNVTNAVVGVPAERFGRGQDRPTRLAQTDVQHLSPVRGALDVRPTAASVMPASGQTVKPPAAVRERPVVATRAPHDVRPALQAEGLGGTAAASAPAPRIVPSPRPGSHQERATATPAPAPQVAPAPGAPAPGAPAPAGQEQRKARSIERATPPAPPGSATPGSARTAPPELRERARPEVPAQPESPRKITKPDEPGVRPMPVPQPPQPPATSRQAPTTQPAPAPQPPATIRQAPPAPPQQAPPAPPPQPPATTRQAPASPGPVVAPRPAPQAPPAQEERGPRGGRDEQQRPDPRGKNPGPSSRVEPPARPEQTQRTERVPRLEPPARAERGEQPQRAERAPHLEPPARAERPESPQPRTERGDRPGRAGRESRLEPSHAKGPVASTQEGGHRDRN